MWHNHVERLRGTRIDDANGAGWYIETWIIQGRIKEWRALIDLRFMRFQDAAIAVETLTRHGIDCHKQLVKAGLPRVKQLACEFLQW